PSLVRDVRCVPVARHAVRQSKAHHLIGISQPIAAGVHGTAMERGARERARAPRVVERAKAQCAVPTHGGTLPPSPEGRLRRTSRYARPTSRGLPALARREFAQIHEPFTTPVRL